MSRFAGTSPAAVVIAGVLLLAGCASASGGRRAGEPARPPLLAAAAPASGEVAPARRLAQAPAPAEGLDDLDEDVDEVYDPWEPFNERMFNFNYYVLDRYVLKPVARGYRAVVHEQIQIMIENAFTNLGVVPRVVNSLLQGKFEGALRELSRFALNSTMGLGGLLDPAREAGLAPSDEDFGQTLGVWGLGPGPYLVLPVMPPMTVRDGIGRGVDGLMNPLTWLVPFIWERLAMTVTETVNERALNYELFEGVEETTLDLYSSVRHFYLTRRARQVQQ